MTRFIPRILRAWPALASALLVGNCGASDVEEPVTAETADPPSALAQIVARDQAFDRAAAEVGVTEAFRTFVDPDGLLFQPGPVIAGPWLAENEIAVAELHWVPVAAGLAASGDLGYTTGPFRAAGPDGGEGRGYYVTIWRLGGDGLFKAVLDIGVPTGETGPLPETPEVAELFVDTMMANPADAPDPDGLQSLLGVDRAFAVGQATNGTEATMAAYAAPSVRIYRVGVPVVVGLTDPEARRIMASDRPSTSPIDGGLSASGTLGYVYGSVARDGRAEAGHYLRIWRRDPDGPWTLALDLVTLPPA
ncbi:MAG: hypothetical protein OEO23_16925 [Gemmatimonadota bacterium]|nr:hypothetical protein [Gemmatimonadota bacterium]